MRLSFCIISIDLRSNQYYIIPMTKILGSTHDFLDENDDKALDFIRIVSDITANEEYQKLKNYRHHHFTTRYQHCLNVAWYAYLAARKAGLDYVSCARGAMLHDFYLYDNDTDELPYEGTHMEIHPKIALINARQNFKTNRTMEDCILHHMWPAAGDRPLTREGYIVQAADKYCASLEVTSHLIEILDEEF